MLQHATVCRAVGLTISSFIFILRGTPDRPPPLSLELSPTEVAATAWVPLSHLSPHYVSYSAVRRPYVSASTPSPSQHPARLTCIPFLAAFVWAVGPSRFWQTCPALPYSLQVPLFLPLVRLLPDAARSAVGLQVRNPSRAAARSVRNPWPHHHTRDTKRGGITRHLSVRTSSSLQFPSECHTARQRAMVRPTSFGA